MRISRITLGDRSGRRRAEALVEWEEAERPPVTVFAEVDPEWGEGFWPDPNAFLTACALPAWHAGERRVRVEGELCPVLRDRIRSVFGSLRAWYPELGPAPGVESSQSCAHTPFGRQTASFLSCGIDSLALLRSNRLQLPADHPSSIQAVWLVDFIREYNLADDESARQADKRVAAGRSVAADAGVDAIPVTTNVLQLEPDGNFFTFKWHGAALLFVAHLFSQRFHRACIASSYDAANLEPWGSHPLLDPYYGSAHLEIEHVGLHLSRIEKAALVADWPAALDAVRVCQGQDSGPTNCGACEKCIRTMTALAALGKLGDSAAFPASDVSPALLGTVRDYDMIYNDSQAGFYAELLRPLRDKGRDDLASVVESILKDYGEKRAADSRRVSELVPLIPEGGCFVLADEQLYGLQAPPPRAGRFWGPPADAATAVRQVEALRRSGAQFLVFRPQTFWWLSYYGELKEHLQRRYPCVSETDQSVVFDLRGSRAGTATPGARPTAAGVAP
jgi:hypothetical protein